MTNMNEMNITPNEITPPVAMRDYTAELVAILGGELAPGKLRERVRDYHENDIAAAIEQIDPSKRRKLFSVLNTETLAQILEYAQETRLYLDELNVKRRAAVLSCLEPSVALEYLEELEENDRRLLLDLMDSEAKDEVTLLAGFDEDEIGSRMTTNYVAIPMGCSVKEAMSALVEQAAENDNIATLYVIDKEGLFAGAIDLKDLIIARNDRPLDSITVASYPYVYAAERIEDCIERIKDYSEDSIPVLDAENRLIGVLISQDVTRLVDDEMSEDYAKLAGLSSEEDLNEPLKKSIAKRLPWLIVLLGLSLLVSGVVGAFEHIVAQLSLIVCFQSLILGMSGNAGTQSLAVTIRVLTNDTLAKKQKILLIGKEAGIGLVNGLVLGLVSVFLIGFYIVLFKHYPISYAFSVSLCTGAALVISILLSSIFGTAIPIFFKKIKVDPAVASGPLITTVNDLVAVLSYYGLAWLLLIRTLKL